MSCRTSLFRDEEYYSGWFVFYPEIPHSEEMKIRHNKRLNRYEIFKRLQRNPAVFTLFALQTLLSDHLAIFTDTTIRKIAWAEREFHLFLRPMKKILRLRQMGYVPSW